MALILIDTLCLSPVDLSIRNIVDGDKVVIMCRIQDEYGLDIDVPVVEKLGNYYVDI